MYLGFLTIIMCYLGKTISWFLGYIFYSCSRFNTFSSAIVIFILIFMVTVLYKIPNGWI